MWAYWVWENQLTDLINMLDGLEFLRDAGADARGYGLLGGWLAVLCELAWSLPATTTSHNVAWHYGKWHGTCRASGVPVHLMRGSTLW
jgi:hypothetical protein